MAICKTLVVNKKFFDESNTENFIEQDEIFKDAYISVYKVDGTKNALSVHLDAHKDKTKTDLIWRKVFMFSPSVKEDSKNFIEQAYLYIKNLPDFVGATDC